MISLIWAMDIDNCIGKDNMLPWHYKEDLKYFRSKIKGKRVLLGMNTYESILSYRPTLFPDSTYYLVTRRKIRIMGVDIINDLDSFIKRDHSDEDIFVIGGASIYEKMLPIADYLYVTIVNKHHDGDAFFPQIDYSKYELIESFNGENPDLTFKVYKRCC